jgi:hypothetical protein
MRRSRPVRPYVAPRRGGSFLAALFLVLTAATAPPDGDSVGRADYRARGVAGCNRDLAAPGMSAADMSHFCDCVFDTYMHAVPTAALPALGSDSFRETVAPALNLCMLRIPAAQARSMQLRIYNVPAVGAAVGATPGVAAGPAPAANSAPDPVERGRQAVDGVPVWAWMAMGLLALALLIRKMARRDDRGHLMGTPPDMRRNGPVRPRDPDPR